MEHLRIKEYVSDKLKNIWFYGLVKKGLTVLLLPLGKSELYSINADGEVEGVSLFSLSNIEDKNKFLVEMVRNNPSVYEETPNFTIENFITAINTK